MDPAPLAATAALVAGAFGLLTLDRWLRRRAPQDLAWTVAMGLFVLGALSLWWAESRGWSASSFRMSFLTGAVLNVPWLALGTPGGQPRRATISPSGFTQAARTRGGLPVTDTATQAVLSPAGGSTASTGCPSTSSRCAASPGVSAMPKR